MMKLIDMMIMSFRLFCLIHDYKRNRETEKNTIYCRDPYTVVIRIEPEKTHIHKGKEHMRLCHRLEKKKEKGKKMQLLLTGLIFRFTITD